MQTLWQGRCSLQYTRGMPLTKRKSLRKDSTPPRREKSEQIQTADKTFERRNVHEDPVTPRDFIGCYGERHESSVCQQRSGDVETEKPHPAISVRELPQCRLANETRQ